MTRWFKDLMKGAVVVAAVCSLINVGGCTLMRVEPWERDLLARDAMNMDADAFERTLDDHIYFSREASSGGRGFGGGGCGCN